MFDVLGFGICALDYLGVVPRFPKEDERLGLVESDVQGGGLVATAMVAAQRLGLRTLYAGCVGDDLEGRRVLEDLDGEGVDTRYVQVRPGARTRHSIILVHPARMSRTILAHNANAPAWERNTKLLGEIRGARLLFLDGSDFAFACELAGAAAARSVPVVIDADLEKSETVELAGRADVVIASRGFAAYATGAEEAGEGARKLLAKTGARQIVVTAGSGGAYGIDRSEPDRLVHQPAFPVDVKDTTGAGDVFHGAYLVGLAKGWALSETLRYASAVAAIKCRELGGRRGIPTDEEVTAFLREEGR